MQEVRKRGLKVAVAGIPKTIDNDIPVILCSMLYGIVVKNHILPCVCQPESIVTLISGN
jgi:hypothetical protein